MSLLSKDGRVAFERRLALGQMAAGLAEMAGGAAGGVIGRLIRATGIGATVGVPAIAVSAVVVTAGAANVAAGLAGLMSSGSGGDGRKGGNVDDDSPRDRRIAEGRSRGANRADGRMVDDVARRAGISNRSGFGKFIESEKRAAGRGGADNFTWEELIDLAAEFKANGER